MNEKETPAAASLPAAAEQHSFSASGREIIAAVLMYFAAYWYVGHLLFALDFFEHTQWLMLFTLLLAAVTELIHWNKPRSWESWIWLGCIVVIEAALTLGRGEVWGHTAKLFLHICFVWWVLSRSGVLLEGETGHLMLADVYFGYLIYPFKHFFLRIRCLLFGIKMLRPSKRKIKTEAVLWSLLAAAAAIGLFAAAFSLLASADIHFRRSMEQVLNLFTFRWERWDNFLAQFVFSLPVAAWLFGLIAGTGRENRAELNLKAQSTCKFVDSLRHVPTAVWIGLTAGFCALYAVFFILHAPYLLGAFTRNLPAGYSVARYARQGFFELCKVMAVNFTLLWLITRMGQKSIWESKFLKAACLLLLAESLVFAAIAASKLWLYIQCFGYTPLRLQSAWLICSLVFGCVCAIWSILRKEKTFRVWVIFSAVTLSVLHLI